MLCADHAVKQHEQRRKQENDAKHADNRTARHQHTHGADNVDVRIKRYAERCGKQSHAADMIDGIDVESAVRTASRLLFPPQRSAL